MFVAVAAAPSSVLAQTENDGSAITTIGIEFDGCDVDQASVAKNIGFETGAKVDLAGKSSDVRVTIACVEQISTIEIVDEAAQTRIREIDTKDLSPPGLARLLALTTVELYETRLTDTALIVEPVETPRPEPEPKPDPAANEEFVAPAPPPVPTRSWSAGLAGMGSTSPSVLVSPAVLARAQWRVSGPWGIASTAMFAFSTTSTDIGRVAATSLSASLGATLGSGDSLLGWSAESGARLSFAALNGLSSRVDVDTSSAGDFSAGPFLAGLYRWQALGDFSVLGRAEAGYNFSGAVAQADGVTSWSNEGIWVMLSVTTGLLW